MKHLGLFEGIGGFSVAAREMGWQTVAWSEINPFCRVVLRYFFPEAEALGDITKIDFTKYANTIDILTGGFPCQPYSLAGKRKGKDDERHLWPQMLRAIREIKPRWVVGENVFGIVSWDGGLVFEEVQADLEAEGYEVQPYVLPAAGVNAPHRRDRVWFVAHSHDAGGSARCGSIQKTNGEIQQRHDSSQFGHAGDAWDSNGDRQSALGQIQKRRWLYQGPESSGDCQNDAPDANCFDGRQQQNIPSRDAAGAWNQSFGSATPDTSRTESQRSEFDGSPRKERTFKANSRQPSGSICSPWENFPTRPPICGGDDGIPRELDSIAFSKWRNEAIKALGNAIVPQVAIQIFKAIQRHESCSH